VNGGAQVDAAGDRHKGNAKEAAKLKKRIAIGVSRVLQDEIQS
jgi:hypothetical protein